MCRGQWKATALCRRGDLRSLRARRGLSGVKALVTLTASPAVSVPLLRIVTASGMNDCTYIFYTVRIFKSWRVLHSIHFTLTEFFTLASHVAVRELGGFSLQLVCTDPAGVTLRKAEAAGTCLVRKQQRHKIMMFSADPRGQGANCPLCVRL